MLLRNTPADAVPALDTLHLLVADVRTTSDRTAFRAMLRAAVVRCVVGTESGQPDNDLRDLTSEGLEAWLDAFDVLANARGLRQGRLFLTSTDSLNAATRRLDDSVRRGGAADLQGRGRQHAPDWSEPVSPEELAREFPEVVAADRATLLRDALRFHGVGSRQGGGSLWSAHAWGGGKGWRGQLHREADSLASILAVLTLGHSRAARRAARLRAAMGA